jgi:hypothetical protein
MRLSWRRGNCRPHRRLFDVTPSKFGTQRTDRKRSCGAFLRSVCRRAQARRQGACPEPDTGNPAAPAWAGASSRLPRGGQARPSGQCPDLTRVKSGKKRSTPFIGHMNSRNPLCVSWSVAGKGACKPAPRGKTSVLIDRKSMEPAVQALHDGFGLARGCDPFRVKPGRNRNRPRSCDGAARDRHPDQPAGSPGSG